MFQFTHPGRGATVSSKTIAQSTSFQFTHPGRGATSRRFRTPLPHSRFNSRTPGGVRLQPAGDERLLRCFNSRTPGGVRLRECSSLERVVFVSIHAPREGCDITYFIFTYFFPSFQFTHPGRGATVFGLACLWPKLVVSIHAPREGCDVRRMMDNKPSPRVSIHAPREGCDGFDKDIQKILDVSIHAPREGCDSLPRAERAK